MKKIHSIFILSLYFLSFAALHAEFSFGSLYKSVQKNIQNTGTFLIDNAWKIAGGTSLAVSAASSVVLAKEVMKWCKLYNLQDTITSTAVCSSIPLATGVLGLICLNMDKHFLRQDEEFETAKESIIAFSNGIKMQQQQEDLDNYFKTIEED